MMDNAEAKALLQGYLTYSKSYNGECTVLVFKDGELIGEVSSYEEAKQFIEAHRAVGA